jgi:5-formyltetrahydrofolate cyclo-ligase
MTKTEIRKDILQKRMNLTSETIIQNSESIKLLLIKNFNFTNQNIHIYLPIIKKKEIDTFPIINFYKKNNCTIVLSKSNFSNSTLTNYIWDDYTELVENEYGILEPINGEEINVNEIKIVLIPLLSFDIKGNRLGYGKGFYDRFLKQLPVDSIKIGLSHFESNEELLPIDKHDIGLDYCVSPTKVYSFK